MVILRVKLTAIYIASTLALDTRRLIIVSLQRIQAENQILILLVLVLVLSRSRRRCSTCWHLRQKTARDISVASLLVVPCRLLVDVLISVTNFGLGVQQGFVDHALLVHGRVQLMGLLHHLIVTIIRVAL